MEYKILFHNSTVSLAKIVNQHLSQGWKLQGGASTDGKALLQAVVKEKQ